MKQIELLVKLKELKKIVSGEKVEDYRRTSRYNMQLLTEYLPGAPKTACFKPRTDIDRVRFVAGFDNPKYAICEINGIFADKFDNFVPEGMKPGTVALTIEIRQVIEHNLKDHAK